MEQLLTANVATSLYWLGRYIVRTEATLIEINKAYDQIIDVDKDAGVRLYKKFQIDLEYTDAVDFLDKAIRSDHVANLATIMHAARENAIISRSNIDAEAFGEIIELEALLKSVSQSPLPVDYKEIDQALSLISEIWGAQIKSGHRKTSSYFFKLGRLVEEVDLRLRFELDSEVTEFILEEINSIFKILSPELELVMQSYDTEDDIMDSINKKMDRLIIDEQ